MNELNINEMILFINNDEDSYKALLRFITAIKKGRALSPISGVVSASIKRYRKVTGTTFKLSRPEIVETAKRLIREYKKEIELGNY